jgi:hypothetical protein
MANEQSSDEAPTKTVELQLGGYYANKTAGNNTADGMYEIQRLLDIDEETWAYHGQLFSEEFDHIPAFDEVQGLSPWISHVPIDIDDLIRSKELTLLGHRPLTTADTEGYAVYLTEMGYEPAEIEPYINELLERSKLPPEKVTLSTKGSS